MSGSILYKEVKKVNLEFLKMKKYEHEELLWNNPQIEIEHDIMEAEQEFDDVGISDRLRNKLRR